MFGNLASIMYSLAGGLLSLAVMLILKKQINCPFWQSAYLAESATISDS